MGSGPSRFGIIPTSPGGALFTFAPFAVVPSFIVPLDIVLRLLSTRFARAPRPTCRHAATGTAGGSLTWSLLDSTQHVFPGV